MHEQVRSIGLTYRIECLRHGGWGAFVGREGSTKPGWKAAAQL